MASIEIREARSGLAVTIDGRVWREVVQSGHSGGYRFVSIRRGRGAKSPTDVLYVHRLVLEAYRGPCPEGMNCRHLNGDRADNRLENLAWGTWAEQAADKVLHGTQPRGESQVGAVLREADIPEIRRLSSQGVSARRIARRYRVSPTTIESIFNGKTWGHIPA